MSCKGCEERGKIYYIHCDRCEARMVNRQSQDVDGRYQEEIIQRYIQTMRPREKVERFKELIEEERAADMADLRATTARYREA